jgi:hypothetical protein
VVWVYYIHREDKPVFVAEALGGQALILTLKQAKILRMPAVDELLASI